jgi:hypothetical protein
VDLALGAGPGDRVAIVAHLGPRIDFLTRLAVGGAEVAIVEHHHRQACRAEVLGEAIEVHLFDGREAVCHHDRRCLAARAVRRVEPSAQNGSFRFDFDIPTHHFLLVGKFSNDSLRGLLLHGGNPLKQVKPLSLQL